MVSQRCPSCCMSCREDTIFAAVEDKRPQDGTLLDFLRGHRVGRASDWVQLSWGRGIVCVDRECGVLKPQGNGCSQGRLFLSSLLTLPSASVPDKGPVWGP